MRGRRERSIAALASPLNFALRGLVGGKRPTQPDRILIVKPCCIGDVLFATPLLATVSAYWPTARISWLVGSHARAALLGNPRLYSLLDWGDLGAGHYPPMTMWQTAKRLRHRQFAAAFIPDRSPALALLTLLAGIPYRAGLNSKGRGLGLSVAAEVDDAKQARHEVDIYLDVARAAGLPLPAPPRMEYHPTTAAQAEADALLASLDLDRSRPIVTIHPGGGVNPGANMPNKRWPRNHYFAIATRLAAAGANVLILGGKGDEDRHLAHTFTMIDYAHIHDLSGQLDLPATAALLRHASLHLGNDTGVSHLAVAVGCRTIAIFGPTSVLRYGLYAPPRQARSLHPAAYPDGGGDTAAVSPDEVWQAMSEMVNGEW